MWTRRRRASSVSPILDKYVEQSGLKFLEDAAKYPDHPVFIDIDLMKNHQPNPRRPSSSRSRFRRQSTRMQWSNSTPTAALGTFAENLPTHAAGSRPE